MTEYAHRLFDSLLARKGSLGDLLMDGRFFRGNAHPYNQNLLPYTIDDEAFHRAKAGLVASTMRLVWLDLVQVLKSTGQDRFDMIYVSNIFDRWHLFNTSLVNVMELLRASLARHGEALIIGHIDPKFLCSPDGRLAQQAIASSAAQVGMQFTKHCPGAPEFWTLSDGS
jgi:hypothetical protein